MNCTFSFFHLTFFLLFSMAGFAQTNGPGYTTLVQDALAAYNGQAFQKAAALFEQANRLQPSNETAYNAACCWARAGKSDSAFHLLNGLAGGGYQDYNTLTNDGDLASLHQDARWSALCQKVKDNQAGGGARVPPGVGRELDSIYKTDQDPRFAFLHLRQEMAGASGEQAEKYKSELARIQRTMKENDSLNLGLVKDILDRYGWPGQDQVSFQQSQALFLVIQHADLATQEKYLPMIKEAARTGKTSPSNLAILEDRVALRQNKKQIYGSQVWTDPKTGKKYVDLLDDPGNVDKRRAAVGLPPMADYLSQFFQMKWDPTEYKNVILPELEEIRGKK